MNGIDHLHDEALLRLRQALNALDLLQELGRRTAPQWCGFLADQIGGGDGERARQARQHRHGHATAADAGHHTTAYAYDAFGDLLTVTDPKGNVITNTFDLRGNKTASHDPDMGSWSYGYDVLGELTSQTDARSQATALTYDLLGRPLTRTESGLYTAWTYGTAAASHNVGRLVEAKACTASGCAAVVTDRTLAYDSLGRPTNATLATGGGTYTTTTGYDAYSRVTTVARPSGLTTLNVYTSLSYLSQVKDNATGAAIDTINARDAELHLTQDRAKAILGLATPRQVIPTCGAKPGLGQTIGSPAMGIWKAQTVFAYIASRPLSRV